MPGVTHSPLLVQSGPVPGQAVNGVKHYLSWSGREHAVGEARPDVRWQIDLGKLVRFLRFWFVTSVFPVHFLGAFFNKIND